MTFSVPTFHRKWKIQKYSKKENYIHATIIVNLKPLYADGVGLIPDEPPNVTSQVTAYLWLVFFNFLARSEI